MISPSRTEGGPPPPPGVRVRRSEALEEARRRRRPRDMVGGVLPSSVLARAGLGHTCLGGERERCVGPGSGTRLGVPGAAGTSHVCGLLALTSGSSGPWEFRCRDTEPSREQVREFPQEKSHMEIGASFPRIVCESQRRPLIPATPPLPEDFGTSKTLRGGARQALEAPLSRPAPPWSNVRAHTRPQGPRAHAPTRTPRPTRAHEVLTPARPRGPRAPCAATRTPCPTRALEVPTPARLRGPHGRCFRKAGRSRDILTAERFYVL